MASTPAPELSITERLVSTSRETPECEQPATQDEGKLVQDSKHPALRHSTPSENADLLLRLGRLNARVLGALQDRIMAMEATLDDLDARAEATTEGGKAGEIVVIGGREEAVDALIPKLREYSKLDVSLAFDHPRAAALILLR